MNIDALHKLSITQLPSHTEIENVLQLHNVDASNRLLAGAVAEL